MELFKTLLKNCMIAVFWLVLWGILAFFIQKPLLLPGPVAVFERLAELTQTPDFWRTVGRSLCRITLGLVCALPVGAVLAVFTCRFRFLRDLSAPMLTVIQTTPVASIVLLLLVWLGRDILPAVLVFLMVLPVVWRNVTAGVESADPQLLEFAKIYRFSPWRRLQRIYIPSAAPYFLAACRTSLGLAWKAGVAAEVLTVPKNSIGQMLYESKLYLETTDLFAWTFTVILCSLIIEKLLSVAVSRFENKGAGKWLN